MSRRDEVLNSLNDLNDTELARVAAFVQELRESQSQAPHPSRSEAMDALLEITIDGPEAFSQNL